LCFTVDSYKVESSLEVELICKEYAKTTEKRDAMPSLFFICGDRKNYEEGKRFL
jgi:hypothetical protein